MSALSLSLSDCSHLDLKKPDVPECRILEPGGKSFCVHGENEFEREHYGHREISIEEEKESFRFLNNMEKCLAICFKNTHEKCKQCISTLVKD